MVGKPIDLKGIALQLNEASEYNVRFKTGDNVYKQGKLRSYVPGHGAFHEPVHGKVVSHTNASAKVKFEDGSEGTYNHNGRERGHANSRSWADNHNINHTFVFKHDPSLGYPVKHSNVSPEEHKAYSDKIYNDAVAASNHKDDVANLRTKFMNLQPYHVTAEHVKKMKDLMDEIETHNAHKM